MLDYKTLYNSGPCKEFGFMAGMLKEEQDESLKENYEERYELD